MVKFKYLQEKTGLLGNKTKRPVADVYLRTVDGKWILFNPYIDSGADFTLLPFSTGKLIGLTSDGKKTKKLGGISGGIPVIFMKIPVKIGEKEFDARVAWAQVHGVPPLLGRADVFNKFKITFDEKREEITFE